LLRLGGEARQCDEQGKHVIGRSSVQELGQLWIQREFSSEIEAARFSSAQAQNSEAKVLGGGIGRN
jgi:hypothetical protein